MKENAKHKKIAKNILHSKLLHAQVNDLITMRLHSQNALNSTCLMQETYCTL